LRPTFLSGLPFSSLRCCQRFFKFVDLLIAGLLDGFFEVARQFCHLILLRRLRSVTLRPTFSDGLPFSSIGCYYTLFLICYFVVAGLLDGSSDVARQFCHLILLQRLRSVTLRPTFSDGLPFSNFYTQ
jgi:hypothetical protein